MVDMADTKLFDDVTDKRVLNKLIPIGSPHYVQMQALVIDIIVKELINCYKAKENKRTKYRYTADASLYVYA